MAKKIDPKAKAKKQKIYAAIGGVLLLGLLAFQVPRTMKMLHPPNTSGAASTPAPATATTGPIAAPSLGGGNATAVSRRRRRRRLGDPDAAPLPQSGQLLAFGLFRTKDPFAQQLKLKCRTERRMRRLVGPAPSTGSSKPPASITRRQERQRLDATPRRLARRRRPLLPRALSSPSTARRESVQVGGSVPGLDPAFALVSLTRPAAKIGIAGGSLETARRP